MEGIFCDRILKEKRDERKRMAERKRRDFQRGIWVGRGPRREGPRQRQREGSISAKPRRSHIFTRFERGRRAWHGDSGKAGREVMPTTKNRCAHRPTERLSARPPRTYFHSERTYLTEARAGAGGGRNSRAPRLRMFIPGGFSVAWRLTEERDATEGILLFPPGDFVRSVPYPS